MEIQVTEKFVFKTGHYPVKANEAGDRLMNLYKGNDRKLTPEIVVLDAVDNQSPLHPCFEWNNKKAAGKYRIHQATKLIANIKIIKIAGKKESTTRAFVSIRTDETGALSHNPFAKGESFYVSINDAMQEPELKQYTFDQAQIELNAFYERYELLEELDKLFKYLKRYSLIPA